MQKFSILEVLKKEYIGHPIPLFKSPIHSDIFSFNNCDGDMTITSRIVTDVILTKDESTNYETCYSLIFEDGEAIVND